MGDGAGMGHLVAAAAALGRRRTVMRRCCRLRIYGFTSATARAPTRRGRRHQSQRASPRDAAPADARHPAPQDRRGAALVGVARPKRDGRDDCVARGEISEPAPPLATSDRALTSFHCSHAAAASPPGGSWSDCCTYSSTTPASESGAMRTPRTGPHACSIPRKSVYAGQWRASGRLTRRTRASATCRRPPRCAPPRSRGAAPLPPPRSRRRAQSSRATPQSTGSLATTPAAPPRTCPTRRCTAQNSARG